MGTASISIIICTRDRADSLRETLASIGRCIVPAGIAAELVVVDNGSKDHTSEVVRSAALGNLPIRLLTEEAPGLSRARNAGLHGTTSDVVLFTDDDVRVPADWIEGMCRPILSNSVDAVAGGVHFPAEYEPLLAREPFRSKRGWLASSEGVDPANPTGPVGANVAYSRKVVEIVGGFDPNLGAGALGFYEENVFTWRMVRAGFRLGTALATSVEHHFDLSRLTRKTWLNMSARMGRSEAYVNYHWRHTDLAASRTKVWRARLLLLAERLRRPWRMWARQASLEEMQRVQTLAYWEQLAANAGIPHNYPAPQVK